MCGETHVAAKGTRTLQGEGPGAEGQGALNRRNMASRGHWAGEKGDQDAGFQGVVLGGSEAGTLAPPHPPSRLSLPELPLLLSLKEL